MRDFAIEFLKWLSDNYTSNDGSFWHKDDEEGDCELTAENLLDQYLDFFKNKTKNI